MRRYIVFVFVCMSLYSMEIMFMDSIKKNQASNQQQYFCLLQRMDGSYGGGGNRTDAHIQPPPRVSAISIFSTVHPNFEMHWALWHLEFNSQYACRTK